VQLIAWSIPAFIALIALEAWVARRRGHRVYHLPVAISDISCGITSQLFNIFTASLGVVAYVAVYEAWHLLDLDPSAATTWALALLGVDFLYYWWHRLSHEVNLMWAAHIVHHHSEDLNLAVALRQALFTGLTAIPFYIPLALLGVPPLPYFVCKAINILYQFWIHTELIRSLGPAERVINTPSHHRVHHAINPQYMDRNYAGMLIVWDRLFGTFEPEVERPVYGTTKPLRSLSPLWANFHYFGEMARLAAAAPNWRLWLYAWVAPPAWHPRHPYPLPTPAELQRRADHPYDAPVSRGLALYIAVQAAIAVPATMLLLLHSATAPPGALLAGSLLLGAGAVAWAGLFERRAWAWPLELARVIASAVLLHTVAA
jgi:alkylglycerol monooxygenase